MFPFPSFPSLVEAIIIFYVDHALFFRARLFPFSPFLNSIPPHPFPCCLQTVLSKTWVWPCCFPFSCFSKCFPILCYKVNPGFELYGCFLLPLELYTRAVSNCSQIYNGSWLWASDHNVLFLQNHFIFSLSSSHFTSALHAPPKLTVALMYTSTLHYIFIFIFFAFASLSECGLFEKRTLIYASLCPALCLVW